MGILNVTPDSFSDGGEHNSFDAALAHADKLLADGADILDIGGESTRPGATEVGLDEEMWRVIPVLREIRRRHPEALLSVDTRRAAVAEAALAAEADIINDVSGLADPAMQALCAAHSCGVIIMHSLAGPHGDIVTEVRNFFKQRVDDAVAAGITPERLCLDPGIGFHKTTEENVALIRHLEKTRVRNLPLLMALSRKRFIGELLTGTPHPVREALPTVVLSLLAADRGADLHRVHDVRALHDALTVRRALT